MRRSRHHLVQSGDVASDGVAAGGSIFDRPDDDRDVKYHYCNSIQLPKEGILLPNKILGLLFRRK